jgi:hypothetical protein
MTNDQLQMTGDGRQGTDHGPRIPIPIAIGAPVSIPVPVYVPEVSRD